VKTLPLLAAALLAGSPLLAAGNRVAVGSFPPGETLVPLAVASPESDSRTFVKTVVPSGGRAVVEIPSTGTGTLLVWVIPSREDGLPAMTAGTPGEGRALETRLETPSGRSIGPEADGDRGNAIRRFRIEEFGGEELGLPVGARQEALRVLAPEAGLHRLEVSSPDAAAITIAAVELESPLVLTTWAAPLSRQPGEPVTIHARVADGAVPVAGALLTARLAPQSGAAGEPVSLFDDGLHGDGAAEDGHYAATVEDLPGFPAGPVAVRVEAEGNDGQGRSFARTGSSGLVNERGGASLRPGSVQAEWAGDGEARVLRITATASVSEGGEYRLDVLAGGAAASNGSRPGLAWAERTVDLTAGPAVLTVEIPASLLGDSPLHLDVRLLGLTRIGVAGRVTLDVAP
jgi:hypothetical protein